MFLIGLLLGYDHTIENIEVSSNAKPKKQNDKQLNFSDDSFFNGDDFNTPFEEAIEFLKSKIPMTKTEWNELEKKLRFRAFTVGALSEADAIEKVKQALLDNLERGEPFYKAWEKFKDIAKSGGKDYFARYFETVYRTNIQSAYNAGRLMQYKNNTPPAWELLFMEDSRMSDFCTNLMNEVGRRAIKSDDAFWSTVGFPPYHFNCRTTFRAVYPDELQTGEITLIEPQNPTPLTNGFGGNPLDKESFWKLTDTMLERAEKYGILDLFTEKEKELITGGRKIGKYNDDPVINEYMRQREYANKKYETIRKSKPSEVPKIAKHTGFSEQDIYNIRNHVFIEKHRLDEGNVTFSPDPEIAHAWERLTNGTFTKNDILLLNHEKLELELMREKGYTYGEAHNEANKKYYWAKEIKKENVGKIQKNK